MKAVRTQRERDEQTLVIATALGVFVLVLAAVGLLVWVLDYTFGVAQRLEGVIIGTALAVAGTAAMTSLTRSTKR